MNKKAFTLIELIVVVTILAILGTVGFVSFQGYTKDARDSVRLNNLANLSKAMEVTILSGKDLPIPGEKVDISAGGSVFSYQGYASKDVLGYINIVGENKDPLDESYFTYVVNKGLNKYQILGFLEEGSEVSVINMAYANLQDRKIVSKGHTLGVLLDQNNVPVQEKGNNIDISTTTDSFKLHIKDDSSSNETFDSADLKKKMIPNSSCKRILELNGSLVGKDGKYKIDPDGNGTGFEVYCDMTSDGGGWTAITPTMIEEHNRRMTSSISTDDNGGLVYRASGLGTGCGTSSHASNQEMKLPNNFSWEKVRFKEEFHGAVSCWHIFGDKRVDNTYDTNIIPFDRSIDTIRGEIRMGGSNGDTFGTNNRACNNLTNNFWHNLNGSDSRFAEVILRRNDIERDSYLSTGTSCVDTGITYFEYSKIFVK